MRLDALKIDDDGKYDIDNNRRNDDGDDDGDDSNHHNRVGAWFLGPQAENYKVADKLIRRILKEHCDARKHYIEGDPEFITPGMKASDGFKAEMSALENTIGCLSRLLRDHATPFWSPRYWCHVICDPSLPGLLGYITAMLFNPNNNSVESSPLTSMLEKMCGLQLCAMVGFNADPENKSEPLAWGHIPCDGSVANLESIWAARNLKFYPLSLSIAIQEDPGLRRVVAPTFTVPLCTGERKRLVECTAWELLNLAPGAVLDLPERLLAEHDVAPGYLAEALAPYAVHATGGGALEKRFGIKEMKYLVGATQHYSWPKGMSIVGIGAGNITPVPVDNAVRMDTAALDAILRHHLEHQIGIYAVVCIMGSTENGAVDPLSEVHALRAKYQKLGLSFVVHADAAWGGYFASIIRRDDGGGGSGGAPRRVVSLENGGDGDFVPELALSKYTETQLASYRFADSITLDPHKSGFVPYPAGGLCFRDGRMRFMIAWTHPAIYKEADKDITMGVWGPEGSKPGAAAAATWVSHKVIGLNHTGYGTLLGEMMFSSAKAYCHWATMSLDDPDLIVLPMNMLPSESVIEPDADEVVQERRLIYDRIVTKSNRDIVKDPTARNLLSLLGSDVLINTFACNFKVNGKVNDDIDEANYFNKTIYNRLSISRVTDVIPNRPVILMSSNLDQKLYGSALTHFKNRIGVVGDQDLTALVHTITSPFSTKNGFLTGLMDEFKKVALQQIKAVMIRNELKPDYHAFVVQGTSPVYLTQLPMFYMANHRQQFLISAELPHDVLFTYRNARDANPDDVFILYTHDKIDFDSLIGANGTTFHADLYQRLPSAESKGTLLRRNFLVTQMKVLKRQPLSSQHLQRAYPTRMPFYLYGLPGQLYADHVLLRAPNIQITSAVSLQLSSGAMSSAMEAGLASADVVAVLESVCEVAMRPGASERVPACIRAGVPFPVTLYTNPYAPPRENDSASAGVIWRMGRYVTRPLLGGGAPGATSAGSQSGSTDAPPLAFMERLGKPLARGTLTFERGVFVDAVMINADPAQAYNDSFKTIECTEEEIRRQLRRATEYDGRRFDASDATQSHESARKIDTAKQWAAYLNEKVQDMECVL